MNLLASLRGDNVRILRLAQLLEETSVREPARREELLRKLAAEVLAHIRAEERVLFPLLAVDAARRESVARARSESEANERLLEDLCRTSAKDASFEPRARLLASELAAYADFEREELLTDLPPFVDDDQASDLARRMDQERERASRDAAQLVARG